MSIMIDDAEHTYCDLCPTTDKGPTLCKKVNLYNDQTKFYNVCVPCLKTLFSEGR